MKLIIMQSMATSAAFFVLSIFAVPTPAAGKGLAGDRRIRGSVDLAALERDLNTALGEALGCGGEVAEGQLAATEARLAPIWSTLPKNGAGNVERRSLRYVVHRYFARHSALQVRGFEPSRSAGGAGWGDADILGQRIPAFVESFLESSHKLERGFSLGEAARVVATVERLIFDAEGSTLEQVYGEQRRDLGSSLGRAELEQLLEGYMLRWMVGNDEESIRLLKEDRSLMASTIPHWDQVLAFARGEIEALDFQRREQPRLAQQHAASRAGHNALAPRYSFEDAHRIVGDISRTFASFWDSECRSMKALLVDMDMHHTGRVPLSKFYAHGLDTEWRFGESEEYLRELGALDETSWLGKQVIIPNYIQATSNCIVSSEHYLVCCQNDCEGILEEIEHRIGAPEAEASQLLAVVANVTSFDDQPPQLRGELTRQLQEIAATTGGRVMLHGRLFSQWLHFVFPRECPFPHKAGAVSSRTPSEYGEKHVASSEAMQRHASNATELHAMAVSKEDLQWMSQWSTEEELVADYAALGLRAPWERRGGAGLLLALAALLALALLRGGALRKVSGERGLALPMHGKAHFV